ncbi:hypothetical protein [Bdellovibrio sp. HCB274]|uniref:hypothetical protein n=1 Tax=Bdellovibrio sp. HCB274 TaxID=3394361 RepID=UPI0039B4A2EA
MPVRPEKNSVGCQSVLKLDSGLRLLMAVIIPLVTAAPVQAQIMECGKVFSALQLKAPHFDIAMDRALTQSVREFSDYDGLSVKDLQYLVEKVYREEEGRRYRISDYWKLTSHERTTKDLARMVGERATHVGLLTYFRENGLLIDQSKIVSMIRTLNRASLTNYVSAGSGAIGLFAGRMPIVLPDTYMKIATEDMTVLLLRGLDSKEGREIQKKYHAKQELHRAYEHINRNYTRVALAVVFAVLWDKGEDFFKEKHDDLLGDLWKRVLSEVPGQKGKS